jgi:hypothetical protein
MFVAMWRTQSSKQQACVTCSLSSASPAVTQVPHLQSIKCLTCSLSSASPAVYQVPHLQFLKCLTCSLSNASPAVSQVPHMQSLKCLTCSFSSASHAVSQMPHLQFLKCLTCSFSSASPAVSQVPHLQFLKCLTCSHSSLTCSHSSVSPAVSQVPHLPSLKCLTCSCSSASPAVTQVPHLQSLKCLTCSLWSASPAVSQVSPAPRLASPRTERAEVLVFRTRTHTPGLTLETWRHRARESMPCGAVGIAGAQLPGLAVWRCHHFATGGVSERSWDAGPHNEGGAAPADISHTNCHTQPQLTFWMVAETPGLKTAVRQDSEPAPSPCHL